MPCECLLLMIVLFVGDVNCNGNAMNITHQQHYHQQKFQMRQGNMSSENSADDRMCWWVISVAMSTVFLRQLAKLKQIREGNMAFENSAVGG